MDDQEPSKPKRKKAGYDKEFLENVWKRDGAEITLVSHSTNNRNEEYKRFQRIFYEGKRSDYVTCLECDDKKLMKHVEGGGTVSLKRHCDTFHKSKDEIKTTQIKVDHFLTKEVSPNEKTEMADKIALWCAKDFRPFYLVEGQGFIDLIQHVIKVACAKGSVNAKQLLPTADTVKSHLFKLDQKMRQNLIKRLQSIDYVNGTTDHWTDKYSALSYMTVTLQYFDTKSKTIKSRVIGTFDVDDKTAMTTNDEFIDHLKQFNIEEKMKIVTTDNASALKKAFRNATWMSCAAHNLSLAHEYAYGKNCGITGVIRLIDTCKSLVTFVKKSGINRDLKKRLVQEIDTRWDSYYDMLQSVKDAYDELLTYRALRDKMHLNKSLLMEMVKLLKEVKRIRMELCTDQRPTFHLVAIAYLKMIDLMKTDGSEDDSFMLLKKRFATGIRKKFIVSPYHILATYMTPCFRDTTNRFLTDNSPQPENSEEMPLPPPPLLQPALDLLNTLTDIEVSDITDENIEDNVGNPSAIEQSLFADYYAKPDQHSKAGSESERYKNMQLSDNDLNACPLIFWMSNRSSFPKMSNIALWLLSAPATNIASERSFSAIGNVITPHRNRLSPATVDKLLFVRSNLDMS